MSKKRPNISKAGDAETDIKSNSGNTKGEALPHTPRTGKGYTLVERSGSGGYRVIGSAKGRSVHSVTAGKQLPLASKQTEKDARTMPRTGAEALAFWRENNLLGTFADRPEESNALARKLREEAQTRQWDRDLRPGGGRA